MTASLSLYCRLCAEQRLIHELIDLTSNLKFRDEILTKLSMFSSNLIDFTVKTLPETVCMDCIQLLNSAYEFFTKIKMSQVDLRHLTLSINIKIEPEESDHTEPEPQDPSKYLQQLKNPKECLSNKKESTEPKPIETQTLVKHPEKFPSSKKEATEPEPIETINFPKHPKECLRSLKGSTKPIQPQIPSKSLLKHAKQSLNIKKESSTPSTFKTEAPEANNAEFRISFDGYSVKRMYIKKQTNNKPIVSWGTYPWTCGRCDKQVTHLGVLRQHTKESHDVCFSMKCVDCTDDFFVDDFDSFVEHVREHRTELKNFCQHCNMNLDPSAMEDHVKMHKLQPHCSVCGEFCSDDYMLHNHLSRFQKHSDNVVSWTECQWKCRECGMKFKKQDSIRKHAKEVHKKCFSMQCPDCPQYVDNFNAYVEHAIEHRPSLKYYCQYCNIQYSESTQPLFHLMDHLYNQCEKCGESFTSPSSLRSHFDAYKQTKRKKSTITEEELTCDICQKILKSFASLKTHKTQHTKRQKDHVCDRCGKKYYTADTLKSHKVIHENPEPQVCQICKKEFLTLMRLKKHVKTHCEEKKFQCDNCQKYFRCKGQLRNHMACHSDFMRYSCQYCEKRFRHHSVFQIHLRQHTGDRPYVCPVCVMDFANWSNCNKHMKRRHGTTLAKSVVTPQGKVPINPKTGKPKKLNLELVKDWSDNLLRKRLPKRRTGRNKDVETTNREVETTNREVVTTNREVETTNREVVTTNREVETTNREVVTTNREVETTNREVVTTNREVETTNREVVTTNREVETTNREVVTTNREVDITNREVATINRHAC